MPSHSTPLICQGMSVGAKIGGILLSASGPFGPMCAGAVGTFFVPGASTAAVKATITTAMFSGSFILSFFTLPIVGGLIVLSMMTENEKRAQQCLMMAMILNAAYLILSAGIGVGLFSAASVGASVSFATTALCALAGAGAIILAATLFVAVMMMAVAPCLEELTDGGQAHTGPSLLLQMM